MLTRGDESITFPTTATLFIWHYALEAEAALQKIQSLLAISGATTKHEDQVAWAKKAEEALQELCTWARRQTSPG